MGVNVVGSGELLHGCFRRSAISVQTPLCHLHLQYFCMFLAIVGM